MSYSSAIGAPQLLSDDDTVAAGVGGRPGLQSGAHTAGASEVGAEE